MAIAIQPQQQSAPGPKPVNGFLNTVAFGIEFSRDSMKLIRGWHKQYGDTVTLRVGDFTQIMIKDPADVHEVLVTQSAKFIKDGGYTDTKVGLARFLGNGLITSNGDFWRRQRKLAAPAMHAKRISSYADIIVNFTETMLTNWRADQQIDANAAMKKLTMEIIAKCLFNTDVGHEAERVHETLEAIQDASSGFSLIPPWVPTPKELRARRARKELDTLIYGMIRERRATGEDNGDLLSMLLLARDEDGGMMSEVQARDEAVTMFLAGHETTANLLSWTFHLLSQHPEIEAKLHAEVDAVLGKRAATLDDLKKLPYTDMIIKEALRMYPPAWIISRESTTDVEIGGRTYPKGIVFGVTIYEMHHNPTYFPNPDTFDPERFTPENEAKLPKYAYIPFGDGPRVCIGNMFAQMEAALILSTIAARYRLEDKPGYEVKMHPRLTLNVRGGLPMILRAR
jgi:cytochrome P450